MVTSGEIGYLEKVSLTVLVDNKADLIVESSDVVDYFTKEPLLAEHGYSVLIRTEPEGMNILWDAGVSKVALIENIRRMRLDVSVIEMIALSHGHFDHYAAMTEVLHEMNGPPQPKEWGTAIAEEELANWIAARQIPIVAHPAAFRERWWKKDDGTLVGPESPPPQEAWQAAGAKMIYSQSPYRLADGCWTTGFIPRRSFEQSGRPTNMRYREGPDFILDDMEDDQAIVMHVKEKGLVVLSGCAHSGIVNTVEHAREFTGIDRVYAILGGFHLATAEDDEIEKTIAYLKDIKPVHVVPSHCTGFRATSRIAQEISEAFIEGVVGATYHL